MRFFSKILSYCCVLNGVKIIIINLKALLIIKRTYCNHTQLKTTKKEKKQYNTEKHLCGVLNS